MKRKTARHLVLELARRIYLKEHGTLKGFGKVAKHYRDEWRHADYSKTGGYKNSWNSELFVGLRRLYGM